MHSRQNCVCVHRFESRQSHSKMTHSSWNRVTWPGRYERTDCILILNRPALYWNGSGGCRMTDLHTSSFLSAAKRISERNIHSWTSSTWMPLKSPYLSRWPRKNIPFTYDYRFSTPLSRQLCHMNHRGLSSKWPFPAWRTSSYSAVTPNKTG